MTVQQLSGPELVCRMADDLSRDRDRNGISMMVRDETGKNWQGAEQLVQRGEAQHAHAIGGKQSPLILLLSADLVVAGIGLLNVCFKRIEGSLHEDLLGVIVVPASSYPFTFGILGLYRHLVHYFAT